MKAGKLIGRGRTADVYEIDDNKILKLYRENFPKRAVQSEYDISKYIQDHLSIVPRVFELIEHQGKNGIIFEKIEGITLLEYLISKPSRIFKVAKQIAKLHAEIHNLEFKKMLDKLPADNKLCHRDFHPDNVMRSEKGLIVIDWMTATSGSPAGDVARTYYILKHGAPMDSIPFIEKIKIAIYQGVVSRRY